MLSSFASCCWLFHGVGPSALGKVPGFTRVLTSCAFVPISLSVGPFLARPLCTFVQGSGSVGSPPDCRELSSFRP